MSCAYVAVKIYIFVLTRSNPPKYVLYANVNEKYCLALSSQLDFTPISPCKTCKKNMSRNVS